MSLVKRMLRWEAVYWAPSEGVDDFGNKIFPDPIEIKCRWEETNEVFINPQGEETTSSAKVFVDRDLEVTGVLWEGTLTDLENDTNPFANEGAREIKKFDRIPGVRKSRQPLRTCWL